MMVGKEVEDVNIRMPEDAYSTDNYVPTFNAYLIVIVRDSKGNIIRVHRQRSHSPTANFIGLFLPISFFSTNNVSFTITNVTGGTYSYQPGIGNSYKDIGYPNNQINTSNKIVMIQVGSGQQSNPYRATALAAPIANGSGAGQLIYQSVITPSTISLNGNTAYFYITQTYNNLSGGTVTITEVGIITTFQVINISSSSFTSYGNVLVWYDVLSSPISVPDGGSVTIYYTFTVNP
jgi:hypothetical protein